MYCTDELAPASPWKSSDDIPGGTIDVLAETKAEMWFSSWKPCDIFQDSACEEMMSAHVLDLFNSLSVHDSGKSVNISMLVNDTYHRAAITSEEGVNRKAFWINAFEGKVDSINVRGDRFVLHSSTSQVQDWIILGDLKEDKLISFKSEWSQTENGSSFVAGSVPALNSKRWAVGGAVVLPGSGGRVGAIASMDAFVGGRFATLLADAALGIKWLQGAGDFFLAVELVVVPGESSTVKPLVVVSDGVQKTEPLLPLLSDAEEDFPVFADTHVAWIRRYGPGSDFSHAELWASEFSSNPDEIHPFKVAELIRGYQVSDLNPPMSGGWGRVLFADEGSPPGTQDPLTPVIRVVDLTMKSPTVSIPLPLPLRMLRVCGVTRTHAWFVVGTDNPKAPPKVIRWKLPPGGTSPGP